MITPPKAPSSARNSLVKLLQLRLASDALLGLSGPLDITAGLPRYDAGPPAHANLGLVKPSSWDFFILSSDGVGLASMRIEARRALYCGLVRGAFPERILAATRLAAACFGSDPQAYRVALNNEVDRRRFSLILTPRRGAGFAIDIVRVGLVAESELVVQALRDD